MPRGRSNAPDNLLAPVQAQWAQPAAQLPQRLARRVSACPPNPAVRVAHTQITQAREVCQGEHEIQPDPRGQHPWPTLSGARVGEHRVGQLEGHDSR